MLVIRRRAGESLVIGGPEGDHVELEVLEIEGSQIKLGIRAPRHVRVLRQEIAATEQANRQASRPLAPSALARLAEQLRAPGTNAKATKLKPVPGTPMS